LSHPAHRQTHEDKNKTSMAKLTTTLKHRRNNYETFIERFFRICCTLLNEHPDNATGNKFFIVILLSQLMTM